MQSIDPNTNLAINWVRRIVFAAGMAMICFSVTAGLGAQGSNPSMGFANDIGHIAFFGGLFAAGAAFPLPRHKDQEKS